MFVGSTSVQNNRINDKYINMKRFVFSEKLSEIRMNQRNGIQLLCSLEDMATQELCVAGKTHTEIEKVYISNMDFESLEMYTESLKNSLFV